MKFNKTTLLSVATLAMLSISNISWAAGEVIGINSAVKGEVTVQSSGQVAAVQAALKDPIRIGDEINSHHLSSLQVLLKDQTVFTVGANCLLTIDKFVYDPEKNQNAMTANVAKGMFRFMSGNISKSGAGAVQIDTPVASMGVRGTMVEGIVGADAIRFAIEQGIIPADTVVSPGATLFILRGPGQRRVGKNKRGEISVTSGGETVVVRKSGSMIFVPSKDASPIDAGFVNEALLEIFSRRLRTKPKGGPSHKPFALDSFMKKEVGDGKVFSPFDFFDPKVDLDWPSDEEDFETHEPESCSPESEDYPECSYQVEQ